MLPTYIFVFDLLFLQYSADIYTHNSVANMPCCNNKQLQFDHITLYSDVRPSYTYVTTQLVAQLKEI